MTHWKQFVRTRLKTLSLAGPREQEIVEELSQAMEDRYFEALARGASESEAVAQAQAQFPEWAKLRREIRAAEQPIATRLPERWQTESREITHRQNRSAMMFSDFFQDVKYGIRMLAKSRGFAATAILTLALGIGANTAIFTIVNAVLLRSLPYRDPDRLVKIIHNNPGVGATDIGLSVPELDDLREKAGIFDDVSAVWPISSNLTGANQPDRLEVMAVSPNYFSMLGATPQAGRLFGTQDVAQGMAIAAVISDGLWNRSFGRSPAALGQNVKLDGDLYTIVGVLPPGFRHPGRTVASDVEVWVTAGFSADPFPTPARNIRLLPGAIGRLKQGITREQAQAKLSTLAAALRAEFPTDYPAQDKWTVEIEPLQKSLVGDVRPMLLVLLGAVALIILIASVNIANLLLARASARHREVAVRLALGASSGRMVRQMLTESVILSLVAGIAGVLTAAVGLRFILAFVPGKIPRLSEVSMDWTVLSFALLISLLTGLMFGLAPALQSAKTNLSVTIREGTLGSGTSGKTARLRDLLIVAELALAVVLMVGAGLLLRTFWGLLQENPGFNPSQVVAASVWLPVPNDPKADIYAKPEARTSFLREVVRRIDAIPGIELAAITTDLPITHTALPAIVNVENGSVDSTRALSAELSTVTPDYFKAMQVSLVRGRFFSENDETGKDRVALVDETTAHNFWPNRDPLGSRIKLNGRRSDTPWTTVVGVVKDIKNDGLDANNGVPHIYAPMYQVPPRGFSIVARSSLSALTLEPQIRREVQAVDPGLPIFAVRSMEDVIGASLARRRFSAELVAVFAVLALGLASVGIYGLLAYMVGQRSQEIGIRMALGAQPGDVCKLILGKGAILAGSGVLIGLVFAAIAAPMISSLLYGVRTFDPIVFLAMPVVLMAVALLASYIPARRAMRVDPIIALRYQ